MKRLFATVALIACAATMSNAQNMYDALLFSQNNYGGTARSLGLGNAVTAVGGDLGTIGFNPAGSAIARYGQFTVTPGVSVSAVSSAFSPEGTLSYGPASSVRNTRFGLPNIAASMVVETGRRTGMKRFTLAVASNRTDTYNYMANAFGVNGKTSRIAEAANSSAGIDESILANYNSFDNSSVSWDLLTAYQGGMFGSYGVKGDYVGVSEAIGPNGKYHYVPGDLSQASYVSKTGSKSDLILNFGADFNDRLFVGFNLGLPSATYNYLETFYETPVNAEEFPVTFSVQGKDVGTYFHQGSFEYQYVANVQGIYAKIGAIYMPTRSIRLGAAIQSPTSYTIDENWQYSASTSFDNKSFNQSKSSPVGEFSYRLRSSYIVNLGAAVTLDKVALVSVDYEMADFSVMRFMEFDGGDYVFGSAIDPFAASNSANRNFAGLAHKLRVGAELKLTPAFAVRAGYNVSTSPEKYWINSDGDEVNSSDYVADYESYRLHNKNLVSAHYYGDATHAFTLGAGYSSSGSFFADLACRYTKYPSQTFSPYYDYYNCNKAGAIVDALSPRIFNRISLWDVCLTFGWRF